MAALLHVLHFLCGGNIVTILFSVMFFNVPSQSAPLYELAKLGESAVLPCPGECSGLLVWMMVSTGHVVSWCNHSECVCARGYHISHSQYVKGDLSLSIAQADYSRRSWYTCLCNQTLLHRVYLRLQRMDYSRHVESGDSFTVDVLISERVKITFNRTGMEGCKTVYESSEEVKGHSDGDYGDRAAWSSRWVVRNVSVDDGGVYTLWDSDNNEVIATYTLTVTGNTTRIKQIPPPDGSKHWWVWLLTGIVLGIVLTLVFMHFVIPRIQTCWTRLRAVCFRDEARDEEEEKKQQEEEKKLRDPAENLHLVKRSSSQIHDL